MSVFSHYLSLAKTLICDCFYTYQILGMYRISAPAGPASDRLWQIRPNPALAILLAGFGQVPDNNIRAVPCCKQSM